MNGADKLPHTGNNNRKQEKGSHPDEFNPEEKIENRSLTGYAFQDSRIHPGCPLGFHSLVSGKSCGGPTTVPPQRKMVVRRDGSVGRPRVRRGKTGHKA